MSSALRGAQSNIVLHEHYDGDGAIIYRRASKLGCEGIVLKRLGSLYRQPLQRECRELSIQIIGRASPSLEGTLALRFLERAIVDTNVSLPLLEHNWKIAVCNPTYPIGV